MKLFSTMLMILSLFTVAASWAEPKVIYSKTVSTDFTFHYPLQTVRTYNAVQTRPYYYTGRILYLDQNEDISKYRFHYSHRVGKNEWGYFFLPGTKLSNTRPYPMFSSPRLYSQKLQLK